jgi:hypothetical protein
MQTRKKDLVLSAKDLAVAFSDPIWASKFPPVLNVDQAAELVHTPKRTIYDWSYRGLLATCACRPGKRLCILRDKFLSLLFNEGINGHE